MKRTISFVALVSMLLLPQFGWSEEETGTKQSARLAELEKRVASLEKGAPAAPAAAAWYQKIKVNGLLQFWYQYDKSLAPASSFRLRNARTQFTGEIRQDITWALLFDLAPGQATLLDFLINLKPDRHITLTAGQSVTPFGMEGLDSTGKLDFIDRSAMTSYLKWSSIRDAGLAVKGDYVLGGVKIEPTVGIYNGEGLNKPDVNEYKDFAGRVAFGLPVGLQFGAARYEGKKGVNADENSRTGLELRYESGRIMTKGEYAWGRSDGTDKRTYYFDAGYRILEPLQIVARYDWYDLNGDAPGAGIERTVGLNYFIMKHTVKLQANYIFRDEETDDTDNDALRLAMQISF